MTVSLDLSSAKSDSSTRRSLSDLSLSVAKCKKIVVVTGAGISCSSGIPDFRSSDGLYNLVKEQYPDVVLKGRDLFDASLFRDATSTAVFYTFISQLKQSIDSAKPTPTHHFIKTLDDKKKLLRSYTQNIDGLEDRVGLQGSSNKGDAAAGKGKSKVTLLRQCRNVQLHGDIHRVRCQACSAEYPCTEDHLSLFNQGISPDCPECLQRSKARVARSARALRVGSLRPAIVLYDEPHPLGDDIGVLQGSDVARKPDMLIIMGTSLKVHGLKKLVKEFAKSVHSHRTSSSPSTSTARSKAWAGKVVFVNKTAPGSEWTGVIDYHVSGETDEWTQRVVEDWKKMRPTDWEVQQTLVATAGSSGTADVSMTLPFKSMKDAVGAVPGAKAKPKDSKKKVRAVSELENVPPPVHPADAMVLSTPDAHRQLQLHQLHKPVEGSPMPISPSKRAPTAMPISPSPLTSPSKRTRTQSQSHYSALSASPSKRRVKHVFSDDERLAPEARGMLFGFGKETTNGARDEWEADDDEEVDQLDDEEVDQLDDDDDLPDGLGDLSMQSPIKLKVKPKVQVRAKSLKPAAATAARATRTAGKLVKPLVA